MVTHFSRLALYLGSLPSVNVLHLQVEEIHNHYQAVLDYAYKVQQGVSSIKNYGIRLAKTVGFPEEILQHSISIVDKVKAFVEA